MDHPGASPLDALSERLYRLLLLAYPRAFREEYASEMVLAFRDAYREAVCERGTAGVLSLWGDLLYDFVNAVCTEHVRMWMARARRMVALTGQEELAMTVSFVLHVAQETDIGRTRACNEDGCVSLVPDNHSLLESRGALFVVADGMGGHGRGDVASELVVRQVKDTYYQDLQDELPAALRNAVEQAGAAVCRANEAERLGGAGGPEMGATCVAAVLHERTLYVANVGDSRAYVLRAGRLRQVTRDHSLVAQLVERGELSPAAARTHPQRNLIYRALGIPDAEVDLFGEPISDGDMLILCTDGLCGVLEDDEIRAIVERYDPDESARRLIARANALGGPDNVTAVVVRVAVPPDAGVIA
jgi:protein phosphatase